MKIRSIHPGFFSDRKISQLPYEARVLYAGLWCYSDDYGRGQYLPKAIEGAVFPNDPVDIVDLLLRLEKAELIRVYEVEEEVYYEIPKWDEYQSPRYKAKQVIPEPDEGEYREKPTNMHPGLFGTDSTQTQRRVPPDSPSGEGVGEGEVVVARQLTPSEQFTRFNLERAAAELQKRGKQVDNPTGYSRKIAADPQFREESARLWSHRECSKCAGAGFTSSPYSPGGGVKQLKCEEPA